MLSEVSMKKQKGEAVLVLLWCLLVGFGIGVNTHINKPDTAVQQTQKQA